MGKLQLALLILRYVDFRRKLSVQYYQMLTLRLINLKFSVVRKFKTYLFDKISSLFQVRV